MKDEADKRHFALRATRLFAPGDDQPEAGRVGSSASTAGFADGCRLGLAPTSTTEQDIADARRALMEK